MSRAGFGTPKYGGTTFKKTGKIVSGENFLRIAPPIPPLAEEGIWRKFFVTHWGYRGVNQRDANKTVMRPFRCILEKDRRNGGMIKQDCPACTFYEGLKDQAKEMEAKLTSAGKTKDEIKTAMARINQQLQDYRAEAKWYVNVVLKDGTVGDFKLNHKDHMNGIMRIIEGTPASPGGLLKNEGIEPLHPDQGVWFKITRTGDGINPPDTVELEMETVVVAGRSLKDIKRAPLTDEQCEKILKECRDLSTLGGASLTYDQIETLTKCHADPEKVDRVFGARAPQEEKHQDSESEGGTAIGAVGDALKTFVGQVKDNVAAASAFTINGKPATKEQYEKYQRILVERKAKADAEAAEARKQAEEARLAAEAEAAAVAALAIGSPDPMTQSDEDFMASFGGAGA